MRSHQVVCALLLFAARQLNAVSSDDGQISIASGSGSMAMLDIFVDGSARLSYYSAGLGVSQIPAGTFDFNLLRQALPLRFTTKDASSAGFCWSVIISPPHATSGDRIVGSSCDKEYVDKLFETAREARKPITLEPQ